jgi:hypothetical protein
MTGDFDEAGAGGFVAMMVAHGGSKSTNSVPEGGGGGTAAVTAGAVTNGIVADGIITNSATAGGGMTGDFDEAGAGGFGMLAGLESEPPRLTTTSILRGSRW